MSRVINYITPKHPLNALRSHYAGKARERMFRLFMENIRPGAGDTVLDLGVTADELLPESNFFEKKYPYKNNITAASIDDAAYLEAVYPGLQFIHIKPGLLPFEDDQFDIVFCSAVIEHVGHQDMQRAFLDETLRVARRFFITTPNRLFPVEFHTFIPVMHWLPQKAHQAILRKIGMDFWARTENLNLLTPRLLGEIFPPCRNIEITNLYLFGFPSNILAYGEK